MFNLIKKVIVLGLMSMSLVLESKNCLLLKNQERKARKVIVDNDCMTFPYKINVDKCVGSCNDVENSYFKLCNDVENSYFKVCMSDVVKNISVKSLDLISRKPVLKNISFHHSCKCGCLLDEKVCNNKQKWNKDKCRCECLIKENCSGNSFFNVINCSCEIKKVAALSEEEECDIETSEKINFLKIKQ